MGRSSGRNKKISAKSSPSRQRSYDGAIDYLNEEFPFFLTHVLNIGQPIWTSSVDTAAVGLKEGGDFEFIFNPDFAKSLSDEEMGFVMAHETMHIILNHLSLASSFSDHKNFNLAADAVINDYLSDQGLELPDGVVRGEDLIGEDCSTLSVSEVYEQIPKQQGGGDSKDQEKGNGQGQAQMEGSADGEEEGDGQGGSGGDFKSFDDHDWMFNPNSGDADSSDEFFEKIEDDLPDDVKEMRGDESPNPSFSTVAKDSAVKKWSEDKGVTLAWKELLDEIDPQILADLSEGPPPRPSFARRPRSLSGFPKTILPVEMESETDKGKARKKPTIVMALDTSGSIGPEDTEQFITLAKSIPTDKVNLFTCTFTTGYKTLDLENPEYVSGGTSFSAVEDFIKKEVIGKKPAGSKKEIKEYPETILVVTDGEAVFNSSKPTQKRLEENWHWLLTEGSDSWYLKNRIYKNYQKIKKFSLKKFIKRG